MNYLISILLAAFWVQPLAAQSEFLPAGRYSSDSLGSGRNTSLDIKWIDGGRRYAYYDTEEQGRRTYFLLDLKTGRQSLLFDNEQFARQLTPYADSLRPPTPERLGIHRLEFTPRTPLCFKFDYNKRRLQYNIRTRQLREVPKTPRVAEQLFSEEDFSADSLYSLTTERHNLRLTSRSGDTVQLTSDGEAYFSFATGGEAAEEGNGGPAGRWIGRSHKYIVLREDKRRIGEMTLVNSLTERPSAKSYKYVAAGDKEVVGYGVYLVDAAKKTIQPLCIARFPDQRIYLPSLQSFPVTDRSAYLLRRSRTCDSMELCRVDVADDSLRTILRETTPKHLNEQLFEYHILNNGREILWWSERSGRGQFYLYDGDGRLKNAVTDGKFVAGHIVHIDTLQRTAIIEGYGGEEGINPHYRLFYNVSLDGGKARCLTPSNGHHSLAIAPDGKYLYDKWSRMNQPELRRIADMRGSTVCQLPGADLSEVKAKGWREPELLELLAADSVTRLYGVVYLPFEIQPGRKYPIISYVYPGPQEDQVPLAFSVDPHANMNLAQQGFVVIHFSHRGGCPFRGRDYYNFGYGNLRDYALDDDMQLIRQVAARYAFTDLSRVGIYGHSGGGFMTAAAMLLHPEFYHVGVAASGNHDNNIYGQDWSEVYHGITQHTDPDGEPRFECRVPTTVELADRLRGQLLLVHGELDNNVHPASTMRLANALIKANKRFDMLIIPGADHGLPVNYFAALVRSYFAEHLRSAPQPDIDCK